MEIDVSGQFYNLMVDGAVDLGILLTGHQINQFERYLSELNRWNTRINLSGITDEFQIITKHFLDSLAYLKGLTLQGTERLIDLGAGAGFPGLPLKLVKPELKLILLDARFKRVAFLKHLCRHLNLEGVSCLHGRAEELADLPQHREQYDIVVARALTQLDHMIDLAFPYLVHGGKLLVSYGAQLERQLKLAETALKRQAGKLERVAQLKLPHSKEPRNIIIIAKCFT